MQIEPQLGDLPTWLNSAGSMYNAIRIARIQRAAAWPELLRELAGMDDKAIQLLVEKNPKLEELIGRAWEAAMRSADERRREGLARAAAAALRSPDDAIVDELQLFTATMARLETPHVRLLALLAAPTPGSGQLKDLRVEGAMTEEDIVRAWPTAQPVQAQLLKTLENEGLIENAVSSTWTGLAGSRAWSLTAYGRRLLELLEIEVKAPVPRVIKPEDEVSASDAPRPRLSFAGVGRSGRSDLSERAEEILRAEFGA